MLMARQHLSARLHGRRPSRHRAISIVLALGRPALPLQHARPPPLWRQPNTWPRPPRGRAHRTEHDDHLPAEHGNPLAFGHGDPRAAGVDRRQPASSGIAVDSHSSRRSNGDLVTVLRFHAGLVHYALHVGSIDPPTDGAALPASARPAIGAREHAQLLAAFNGGFKMGAGCIPCGVGGMQVAGRVLFPLVRGMTSLVLNRNGGASMGVWGHGFRRPGRPFTACARLCPRWCREAG